MKKSDEADDMLAEYDIRDGVRGKYASRLMPRPSFAELIEQWRNIAGSSLGTISERGLLALCDVAEAAHQYTENFHLRHEPSGDSDGCKCECLACELQRALSRLVDPEAPRT